MERAAMMELVMELLRSRAGWDGAAFGRGKGRVSVRAGPSVRPGLSFCKGKSLPGRSRPRSAPALPRCGRGAITLPSLVAAVPLPRAL